MRFRKLLLVHKRAWLIGITFMLQGFMLPQESNTSEEYKLKAVYLYNFAQFVAWPESSFSSTQPELVIGVLGEDPFGGYLDETVHNEVINGHPLVVNRYKTSADIKNCHILFISKSSKEELEDVFTLLKGRNILTVSDANNFAKRGGMVRFVNEDNKIKIRINLEVVKSENLVVSSKLLRIAEIINNPN